jgi:hypothetical protein
MDSEKEPERRPGSLLKSMVLGSNKASVDVRLGKPVMAQNVLGMTHAGEKAWLYRHGAFDILVGFFHDIARYLVVRRTSGPQLPLAPSELAAALALNAPASQWVIEQGALPEPPKTAAAARKKKTPAKINPGGPTTYFTYVETNPKDKNSVTRELFGFMPADEAFAFFSLPVLDDQPPLISSEWAVKQKLG